MITSLSSLLMSLSGSIRRRLGDGGSVNCLSSSSL